MTELEAVLDQLETKGHRVTPSRVAVVAAVLSNRGNFTPEDLLRQTRGVGRATVFRTLRLLLDADVICRIMLEDTTVRYRVTSRHGHHHHLLCLACGRVMDFTDCADDLMRQLASRTQYAIDGHWLEVYGRCPGCATGRHAGRPL